MSRAPESPAPEHTHKGYTLTDLTSQSDDGRFVARVAIVALGAGRTRSQRFLDLESFSSASEARNRALAAARSWIDAELANDRLALPSNFSRLDF